MVRFVRHRKVTEVRKANRCAIVYYAAAAGACASMQSFVGWASRDKSRYSESCSAPWPCQGVGCAVCILPSSFYGFLPLALLVQTSAPWEEIMTMHARQVRLCAAWRAKGWVCGSLNLKGWEDVGGGFCKAIEPPSSRWPVSLVDGLMLSLLPVQLLLALQVR